MKRFPLWVEGILFGFLFIPLAFFLKIICPLEVGCFIDPFFVPIFSPLLILGMFVGDGAVSIKTEIIFIMVFWATVGGLFAYLWGKISGRVRKQSVSLEVTS